MSDEVSQFLEQVERLRGQQVEDDEARAREQEEFLAAKRERQARREERARSISPQKSSPLNTPSPRSNRQGIYLSDATRLASPRRTSEDRESPGTPPAVDDDAMLSASHRKEGNDASFEFESMQTEGATSSARSSTLSWQRRPGSRSSARPLSMLAAQNATQKSLAAEAQSPASGTDEDFSKESIAKALGSKDPSWFRQTADRGQNSAAYRRNQVEDDDRLDMSSARTQLPGLSTEDLGTGAALAEKMGSAEDDRSNITSPISSHADRFDSAPDDKSLSRESLTLPGRAASTRSPSPTKGLGGFVQSAMMKRSDSVKRWSVTSPPGLSRADSVAATRGSYDRASTHSNPRPSSMIRGASITPTSSRPTSQHGHRQFESSDGSKTPSRASIASTSRDTERDEDVSSSIPTSPSKTMDPRRWSPTKSSWLESALNRPESPKPSPTAAQPTWRDKAALETARQTAVSHKHQVSIGGLMRQSALGTNAKSNPTGLGGIYSPPPNANRPAYGSISAPSASQKLSEPDLDKELQSDRLQDATQRPDVEKLVKSTPTMSPPPVKPKPQGPSSVVKDFRSGLRQRSAEKDAPKKDEPEFKNVFGSLRKTKTQNYVAPDELKNNILRGKAALNLTNGPQKSERRDEFKDAILKKKADFKAIQAEGRGVVRTTSNATPNPTPEGLAKRSELGKTVTSVAKKSTATQPISAVPIESTKSFSSAPPAEKIPSESPFESLSPKSRLDFAETDGNEQLKDGAANIQVVGNSESPSHRSETERSAPSGLPAQRRSGVGDKTLADRFIPGLAGLLAKGPPLSATNGGRSFHDSSGSVDLNKSRSAEPSAPGPQLTHMTKNRARGPRRKAPTNSGQEPSKVGRVATQSESGLQTVIPKTAKNIPEEILVRELTVDNDFNKSPSPVGNLAAMSLQAQAAETSLLRGKSLGSSAVSANTANSATPPQSRPVSEDNMQAEETTPSSPLKMLSQHDKDTIAPSSPKKTDVKRMSRLLNDDDEPKRTRQEPTRDLARLSDQGTGSRSPTQLAGPSSPTKSDRDALPSMNSPRIGMKSPTKSKPSLENGEGFRSPTIMPSPARSPTKQANDISTLLNDFFGSSQIREALKVDPAQMLMSRPAIVRRVTSLGLQMFRILGDGKKLPVSPQNERVLFDQEMYVCAHEFSNETGKKTLEVYYWIGDEVPEASVEDAQLFVQREARSLGGQLVRLRQGKESAEFVQALGGVIIVRKGSSNKYDSLAANMLCGRRYLGQVAFDEVEFSPSSLCAGFTYLITKAGSCYMWTGKGSDVTEVSCARLIGMDLTLTGELIQYEDGNEPPTFWTLFEDKATKPHSADHWRLKPSYEKYCSRLFRSDANSRLQIFELGLFNQDDLSPEGIYILDAFFEIYIVVGSRANSQYASFRNALDFAQEYAILASGMEDRPFVPVSTVVLEGIPRDMKSVFRKWDDAKSPTVTNVQPPGLKRGRSLRVVTLTQALQALGE